MHINRNFRFSLTMEHNYTHLTHIGNEQNLQNLKNYYENGYARPVKTNEFSPYQVFVNSNDRGFVAIQGVTYHNRRLVINTNIQRCSIPLDSPQTSRMHPDSTFEIMANIFGNDRPKKTYEEYMEGVTKRQKVLQNMRKKQN